MADKRAKKLIVDTNAFIKAVRLETIGNEFWTVPQVLSEVRDARAREFLDNFPLKIQTRDPSPASLKAVADFAKKTGDYAFLSAVDIRVLALTHTFEVESKGTNHLRNQPLQPGTSVDASDDKNDETTDETSPSDNATPSTTESSTNNDNASTSEDKSKENGAEQQEEEKEKEDEDDGWITPSNIGVVRAKRGKDDEVSGEQVEVGCLTTDFAMQSVLLQMGMKLISVDGMVIKKIRQYVLKCHACFKICKNMEKKFCPSCGNTTLVRFSVSTDDSGNLVYNQAQRMTNKGTIFPIPLPKGGKNNNDLILTEDQYLSKTQFRKDKKSADVFNDDYSFAISKTGPTNDVVIGYGKKNPNAAKRHIGKKNKPIATLQ